jgi:hypothetical protein
MRASASAVLGVLTAALTGASSVCGEVRPGAEPAQTARVAGTAPGPCGNSRFFWVGSDGNDPFTDEQLRYLVETASTIVIAQFYAGFAVEAHHELARRVKALDPRVNVFAYMSATYVKPRFDWAEGQIKDEWILHDKGGEKIVCKYQGKGDVGAYYADISNPDYRAFLAGVAADWMNIAPYDGIIYDACNFVNGDLRKTFMDRRPPDPREGTPFSKLVSQAKMDELNAGLESLLRETKQSLGNKKRIVWNGFWRKKNASDRSLALLPIGDIALAERWSIGHETDADAPFHAVLSRKQVVEDLGIVQRGLDMGKMFFLKDTFDEEWYAHASPEAVARLARYGWAMYMLIHEPGRTAYGFSPGPRFTQCLHTDPVLLDVPSFGKPLRRVQDLGELLTREFEHGAVYLNATKAPIDVRVAQRATLHGGKVVAIAAGTTVTVPAQDALILQW